MIILVIYCFDPQLSMPLLEVYTQPSEVNDVQLVSDPNILSSPFSPPQLKLVAHPSGTVALFHVSPNSRLKYSVNLLHHNKTLDVDIKLEPSQKDVVLDVGLYSKGNLVIWGNWFTNNELLFFADEYLIVVGWPYFVHFLDVGSTHEPSHHLVFEWNSLLGVQPRTSAPFLCIFNPIRSRIIRNGGSGCLGGGGGDEKTDLSPKYSTRTHLIFHDLSSTPLELGSSALLLPLMEERASDLQFKLAVLHHFLIHAQDVNVAKRVRIKGKSSFEKVLCRYFKFQIIYEEGKRRGNLFLKHIYQEFLVGHAHLQTKKQILPNMDSFLYLIPYSADPLANSKIVRK